MKLVIFAGGYGTRLGKFTEEIPKPMIHIGDRPILWHIMKIYSHYGIKDFIICLGYKGYIIKNYFLEYVNRCNDFTIDFNTGEVSYHTNLDEIDWRVTFVETGINVEKGARLKKVEKYLDEGINLLTYGDGVANIDIAKLIEFHKASQKKITLSGVHPPARYGELVIEGEQLISFEEKPQAAGGYINGGFMVFERNVLELLNTQDSCDFEYGLLERMAQQGEIAIYRHDGFWACMDTERDMRNLNQLWVENKAFWKVWD